MLIDYKSVIRKSALLGLTVRPHFPDKENAPTYFFRFRGKELNQVCGTAQALEYLKGIEHGKNIALHNSPKTSW